MTTYKIVKRNNNKAEEEAIYVFYGNYLDGNEEDPNQLFTNASEETGFLHPKTQSVIFTGVDLARIRASGTPVFFSKQQIHMDDSIATVKMKWLKEINFSVSLEEIYFFCQQLQTIHNVSLFQTLTQGKKIKINKARFHCFLKNIVDPDPGLVVEDKETYDYNDILVLNLNDKKIKMNMILGQSNYIQENEYPFIVDPFLTEGVYDEQIEKATRKSILYLNSNLLLDSGNIIDNTIYLCLASDVLSNAVSNNAAISEITTKIYYPKLFHKQVFTADELEEKRHYFIEENKKITENQATWDHYQSVDMFYDIYKNRKTDLEYVERGTGIKSFSFTIPFLFKTKIPLDVIFKLIHATQTTPLTKYNASLRQEKIYRLYANTLSTDGRKIPYLSKATIFKLIKSTGKNKSVTVYVEYDGVSLLCEFEENGNITISSEIEKDKVLSIEDIDAMIHQTVNPVIQEVNAYIEQSGYHIEPFVSLRDPAIVIKKLTYETTIQVGSDFDLKKINQYKGCFSSLFVFESLTKEKEIALRFKRVSHYNKRTSQEAFIIEKQKEGFTSQEIADELLRNFTDLKRNEAADLIAKIVNELQLQRNVKKRDIEIKINPGFPVSIREVGFKNNIKITVENIDDLLYLETLSIYFDSLVRILSDNNKAWKNLCDNKKSEKEEQYDEVILDEEIEEEEEELNLDEMSDYEGSEVGEERMEYAMKFFDMGDEEEDQEGGQDSDESIPSYHSDSDLNPRTEKKAPAPKKPTRIPKKILIEEEEVAGLNAGLNAGLDASLDASLVNPKKSRTIDGMPLSNKNSYFQKRIRERDPMLILTEKDARFNSYARTCSSSERRQPVILNQSELDDIRNQHPSFLKEEDIIQYGSEPDKQFYYICPRYWDLKNETVVTEEEMKEKNLYDKIIPADAKKVPKGKYIYESKEAKQYPNFQMDSHPKGYCLPCCFSKWNTKTLLERKGQCGKKETETETKKESERAEKDDYVIGPEKFPIPRDRWGYLPATIQLLMKENNMDCQINKNNTNIKPNHTCLLRHGVENNAKQSFVACIADALYYTKMDSFGKPIRKSIKEMKEILVSNLTLDKFISFQNGNLVNDFSLQRQGQGNKENAVGIDTDLKKYEKTKIYSKLSSSVRANDKILLKKICAAFENFIRFLNDPVIIIDHTYLWDMISERNPDLFPYGLNLIIMDIPNNDITNNVQILCPTDHYSKHAYNINKPSLLLIKQGDYYEPLYTYRYEKTKQTTKAFVGKLFSELDPNLSPSMKAFFTKIISPFMQTMCQPKKSLPPQIFKMQHPVLLEDVIENVVNADYRIVKQVVNYDNKVIGVIVEKEISEQEEEEEEREGGFVPCYPSGILNNYEYVFMLEDGLWKNYEETVHFLIDINKESNGLLHCHPAFLVAEDEMIVGILTETNQFVSLSEPYPSSFVKEDIPILKESNHLDVDSIITSSIEKGDEERKLFVKKIKLESQLYTVFRNTVRILLNQYENTDIRESIEEQIKDNQKLYTEKLSKVNDFLKDLVERNQSISFQEDTDMFLSLDEKEIASCIVFKNAEEKCNEKTPLCSYLPALQQCQLLLPQFNLVQQDSNNEIYYYARMADEIIRYSRIKSFLFQPQTYLSFNDVKYNLRDDEILLLESFITQEYFEKLIPVETNPYVKYNNYDTVEPIQSLDYTNEITFTD
jgi:hypothetical protein